MDKEIAYPILANPAVPRTKEKRGNSLMVVPPFLSRYLVTLCSLSI
ncbi:MAG: hypothetical protein ACI83P_002384 [Janthinobacterium sp.]|jgi:hypothetical protein